MRHTFLTLATFLTANACSPTNTSPNMSSREVNILLRSQEPPSHGKYGQGDYPPGTPMDERIVGDGVMIGSQVIPREQYAILKRAGFVPFRREMTDTELLEAFTPELRAQCNDDLPRLISKAHANLNKAPEIPSWSNALFTLPKGTLPEKAETTYQEWFTPDGTLREEGIFWKQPPSQDMVRWAAAYKSTGDEKWARAVIKIIEYYYHNVRPPARKGDFSAEARHMWRTLNMGAYTPSFLEAYLAIQDWPGLTDQYKANFLKGAIERGQYLHFTTSPAFPWLNYNPFGYANWILYQLQGELAIATTFPCFKEAAKWRDHAAKGIALHAEWTIQPDGSHDEFSYDYANQVGEQFTWCYLTLLRHGYPLPEGFKENLLRLNEQFLELYCPGNQKVPFGDTHRGDAALGKQAKIASIIFQDSRFKRFAGEMDDEFLDALSVILSPEDPQKWARIYRSLPIAPLPQQTSSVLPDVGWSILRTGWGEHDNALALGYRGSDNVAHSAREHLGLNIWVKGRPLMTKLLGEKSYTEGYPEGYINTPRLANMVLLKDAGGNLLPFNRDTGTLRNWYSSPGLDYIDADHLAWAEGKLRARRRVLFIKPDWAIVIDDIEKGEGALPPPGIKSQWQAHVGRQAPTIIGKSASWSHTVAQGTAFFLDAKPEVEALTVEGTKSVSYLLKASPLQTTFPIRYVTAIYFGDAKLEEAGRGALSRFSGRGYDGVIFPTQDGPRHILWETVGDPSRGRFIVCSEEKEPTSSNLFAATDEGALPEPLLSIVGKAAQKKGQAWNGRVINTLTPEFAPPSKTASQREITGFQPLPWSGQPQLRPSTTTPTRFSWQTASPAVHSLLYRAGGEHSWRRALQPDLHREAWILAPDLVPGKRYEVQAVAEFPDGTVSRSEIIQSTP